MHGASEMQVLVARGRRVGLLLVWERSQRLVICEGFKATAIRAKARPGLLVSLD